MSEAKNTAKVFKTVDQTLASRREQARAFRRHKSTGVVQNAADGLHYTVFFSGDHHESSCNQMRDAYERRGYEPVNGPRYEGAPRPEFVVDRPTAEIWCCPAEIRDDEWRDSLLECLRSAAWVADEARKPELRSLSNKLRDLAMRYHKLYRTDGAAAQSAWGEIDHHVNNTPVLRLGSRQE